MERSISGEIKDNMIQQKSISLEHLTTRAISTYCRTVGSMFTSVFHFRLEPLEAMSCGCSVVGSSTAPVRSNPTPKKWHADRLFNPEALAETICAVLKDRALAKNLVYCWEIIVVIQTKKMPPRCWHHELVATE